MKLVKKHPILGSSADSSKLSTSIRGLLVLLIPLIINMTGIDIPQDSILEFFDQGVIFYGMVVTMFGLGRKIYYKIKKLINNR